MAGEEKKDRTRVATPGPGMDFTHLHACTANFPALLNETVPDGKLHVLHSCGTREKRT